MKILMISNHLGVQSGVQRYVQNLLLHLDTAKYRVTLFVGQCPPDQASTAPALEAHGVEILAVPDNKKDRIRALAACPILFLTAKTEEADVLTGLGLGGDDYLSKPFRIAELRARVAAHLRRESRAPRSRIRRGGLDFDLEERAVYCGEEPLHLTRGEYAICAHLAAHPAQTFTKEQIYEAVFGFDGTADSSAITEHIKNIRAKLRAVGLSPIQTVWGVGYKWESA